MIADRLAHSVVRYPIIYLLIILGATSYLAYHASKGLSLNVVLEEMLPVGRNNVQLIQKFGAQFGGANTTLISLRNESGSIYDPKFLEAYQNASDEIYFHPDVIRHLVQSLSLRKTKAITGSAGRIQIDALMWPKLPQSQEEFDRLRRNVKAQYEGLLVSDDERAAMIVADFQDGTDYEGLVRFLGEMRESLAANGIELYTVGRPILLGTIYLALDRTFLILGLSLIFVGILLLLYFRNWLGVVVPMVSAGMATSWGLGAMGLVHYNLDPLLTLLPAFIFAIVLSHSVQFVSRVFEAFEEHHRMRDAVRHALAKLLFPSFAAILTDAAGFTVLILVGIPSIQALALICTVWLLAIVPSLIFSAALLRLLPRPNHFRTGLHFVEKIWLALNLQRSSPVAVVTVLLCLGLGAMGAAQLTIGDASGSPILWSDSQYNVDAEVINEEFSGAGTDLLQVYIEGGDNTMLDPTVYHRVEALDRHVYENVPEARRAQSLVPIIKKINGVLYEGDPSYELVPDTSEEIGFNIYLFRSKGEPGDFAAYTNPEWEVGNVSIPLKDHTSAVIDRAIAAVSEFVAIQKIGTEDPQLLYAGGQVGITKAVNDEIRASNFAILVAIVIVIALCILVLYRSVSLGLLLILSLMTANFLTYAFMAAKGIGLSISTLPLTALGIGLGVDYGIYMLDRIREEVKSGLELFGAVKQSMITSGNAIFVTAMTMVLPLLPWSFLSELRFQAEMGLLLGMVLFLNMIGSLIFIPAAVLLFKPKAITAPNGRQFAETDAGEFATSR